MTNPLISAVPWMSLLHLPPSSMGSSSSSLMQSFSGKLRLMLKREGSSGTRCSRDPFVVLCGDCTMMGLSGRLSSDIMWMPEKLSIWPPKLLWLLSEWVLPSPSDALLTKASSLFSFCGAFILPIPYNLVALPIFLLIAVDRPDVSICYCSLPASLNLAGISAMTN